MKFSKIIKDLQVDTQDDFEVKGVATDSREVKDGYIFFALKGETSNGADYIDSAKFSGAKAVFSEQDSNAKMLLNVIAERFYSPLPENLIAVTGTNGKTSVANFTANIIKLCGKDSASVGTLGTLLDGDFEKQFSYSGLTSPDIITLLKDLNGIKKKNIDYVAIEASSHGLHQQRMGNLRFKTAAFTNFTQDHLDYHGNMEAYFEAKMLLFIRHIDHGGTAVLNADIPEFEQIKKICDEKNLKVISYGTNGKDIKIKNIKPHDKGLDIEAEVFGKNKTISTSLIGRFQAYNVVCAIANAASLDFGIDEILKAVTQLRSVKGRMDVILSPKQNAKIVIDYAHTPDALEKAIDSLRVHTSGKLITLFGCGGDRDKTKRPLMGKIASDKSDVVIVTDDNPRTEVAAQVRKDIMAATHNAKEIEGRKEAIAYAISLLKSGDSLLLAGKGHEDYQIIGKEKLPFDEFRIVGDILAKI